MKEIKRILVAPDKFKGSLNAGEVAAAITRAMSRQFPQAECLMRPIADGGDGFMEALRQGNGGEWVACNAVDALNRPISSRYLLSKSAGKRIAVIEMAETAGIVRIQENERNPLQASTRGVGMQMKHAVQHSQAEQILLGLGGSATNDGGCGMAAALGVQFFTGMKELPATELVPQHFLDITKIDLAKRIPLPPVIAACDVDNPLLGERGATAVYGPQKGADADMQKTLEAGLAHLVNVAKAEEAASTPGAGAAGGLGFGLLHFAKAKLVPGFSLVAEIFALSELLDGVDLVVTGEGALDAQSLHGKGPVALAKMAQERGIPVIAVCGVADKVIRRSGHFKKIYALADTGLPLEELIKRADELIETVLLENH